MDRFLSMQAFVRVAETESFAEAARQLGVAKSVVTTRIRQFEGFIGTPLFHRTTRSVKLSEAGGAHYRECAELIARFDGLTDHLRSVRGSPTGILRIHALPGFAIGHLAALLHRFQDEHPQIQFDLVVNDRVIDPVEEGFDVALQIFAPASGSLIAHKLFPVRRLFLASPDYLKRNGSPRRPKDLLRHRLGVYDRYPTRNRWQFLRGRRKVDLELIAHLRSNSVHLLKEYALEGAGVVCIPTIAASEDLLAGRLRPVLGGYRLSSFWLTAVYPGTHRYTTKVKLFLDFIARHYKGNPPWDQALMAKGLLPQDAEAARAS